MFSYTGHPYCDIGVATITAFVGKHNPTQLTTNDLEQVANYIQQQYVRQPLRSFLTVVFPNSGFTQPAYFDQPEKQADYSRRVLKSYDSSVPLTGEQCVFTGQPAVAIAFDVSDKLTPGRAFRQHIPLLTGEGSINFFQAVTLDYLSPVKPCWQYRHFHSDAPKLRDGCLQYTPTMKT